MICIITPNETNYLPLKYIYDQYREGMNGDDFSKLEKDFTFFFFESETETFIGCIYFYSKKGKIFVNAFATRKHHNINLYIFKRTLKLFNAPIYAECLNKASLLCVLKCGFKKYKDNIYIYKGE